MAKQHEPLVILPSEGHQHTHTIIFLHGRDSTNEEFASELFESEASGLPDQPRTLPSLFPTIRWVFPAAPFVRSARFDTEMAQWFDMWSAENPQEQPALQHKGLKRSVSAILDLVRSEESRVQLQKIFLAGISQGFATVVAAFFADARRGFAGLIGLSSWMPCGGADELMQLVGEATKTDGGSTPVLLCHSSDDDVVPVENGRALRDALRQSHVVEWHEYQEGGHWVNEPQGVDDIVSFLRRHMSL